MACVIYQGFLQKTPPLDKLIVTWKKRWFILSQRDPFDPRSVELTYYSDSNLEEKRGTIDMPSITRIHPSPSKAKGHIFSIEIKDKKIMLKADDAKTKGIWIAKLYEFAGQGHNYHVTVPNQPMAPYSECLLQLSRSDSQISITPPTSNTPILDIPYSQIRRFGYQVVMENYDVIWCETCRCHSTGEQDFCFFVVASGMDRAMLIAGDLKTKIEKDTGKFLIMEDDKHPESTYISRNHYGCLPYPKVGRDRILHSGLVNLEATKMLPVGMKRRATDFVPSTTVTRTENDRRNTVQNLLGTTPSPRHSPTHSPSPSRSVSPHTPGGLSLHDVVASRGNSLSAGHPGSTSDPTATYTGKTLTAFDQSRRSDGAYLSVSDGAKSLSNWKGKKSPDPYISGSNTAERSPKRSTGKKMSLADLKMDRVGSGGRPSKDRFFPSKDSGIGTSADLILDHNGQCVSPSPSPNAMSRKASQPFPPSYDHLSQLRKMSSPEVFSPPRSTYDHLEAPTKTSSRFPNCPPIPPRSGVSLGDPYQEF